MKNIKIEFSEDEIVKLENCIKYVENEAKRIKSITNLNDNEQVIYFQKYMRYLKEMKEKIYKAKGK